VCCVNLILDKCVGVCMGFICHRTGAIRWAFVDMGSIKGREFLD